MVDTIFSAGVQVLSWPAIGYLMVGIGIGFVVGLLPGLGGAVTLALMLPFVFGLEPINAFALLVAMFATTSNTGELTSILFGVPGEGTTAASILDGHPMATRGEAGRAMGASLASSAMGAIIGVVAIGALIPILRPVVLSFSSPELFALSILGITFISALSGASLLRGVAMGGLGLSLSTMGTDHQFSILRYTFDQTYLYDGLGLIPIAIGLFAVPEIIDLFLKGTSISQGIKSDVGGVRQGVWDAVRHRGLVIRSGIIGVFIGIIPGIGSAAAQWTAYAHAVQSSPNKERFGHGAIEGVLAPGTVTNAKEGGALVPTLLVGVPGSLTMAILLTAFFIVGLVPGPEMVSKHLDVVYGIIWAFFFGAMISVALAFAVLGQLARITNIRAYLLVPFIIVLVWLGAFGASNNFGDLALAAFAGLVGFVMVKLDWPRPPLVLGLVLGPLAEKYLGISVQRYDADWIGRPIVIAAFAVALLSIVYSLYQHRKMSKTTEERADADTVLPSSAEAPAPAPGGPGAGGTAALARPRTALLQLVSLKSGDLAFAGVWAAVVAVAIVIALPWQFEVKVFPLLVLIPTLLALLVYMVRRMLWNAGAPAPSAELSNGADAYQGGSLAAILGWIVGSFTLAWMIGFQAGLPLFIFLFLKFQSGESWFRSVLLAAITWGILYQFFGEFLVYPWPEAQLQRWISG